MLAFIPLLVIALVVLFVTTAAGARGHKIAAALGGLALLGMLATGAVYREVEHNARRAEIKVEYDTAVAAARKQGRQADAQIDKFAHGGWAEAYPDGTTYRGAADGSRMLVQGPTHSRSAASYSTRSYRVSFVGLIVPIAAIAAATALLRRRRGDDGNRSGLGLVGLGIAGILVAGMFWGVSRSERVDGPAAVVGSAAVESLPEDVPLDALWDRLTAPKIALDGKTENEAPRDSSGAKPAGRSPAAEEGSAGNDIAAAPGEESNPEETPERPKWLDAPPTLGDGLRREIVSTAPFATLKECHDELLVLISGKVRQRIAVLSHGVGARGGVVPQLTRMSLRIDQLLDQIVVDQYIEPVDASFGEMLKAHVLLEFGPEVDERLIAAWQAYVRRDRLGAVAATAGACVGVVALAFGLLKLDTWTRGYYTKRLFLGVPAAIIGALALLGLLS